jgi:MFS family permease
MRVAARYQSQQSLIGPTLFPIYKFVLKVITCVYLGPWFLVWIGVAIFIPANHADTPLLSALSGWAAMWTNIFFIFGLVTLIFAVLERVQARVPEFYKWDPRKLPAASKRKDKDRVPRAESIFGLIFSVLFALWWLGLPRYGILVFGAVTTFSVNPALHAYYLPLLIPTLLLIVQQCINLFRPQWTWLRAFSMVVADAISLGIVVAAARIYPFVIFTETGKNAADWAHASVVVNQVIQWSAISIAIGIGIALAVHAFKAVQEIRRMMKERRSPAILTVSQLM